MSSQTGTQHVHGPATAEQHRAETVQHGSSVHEPAEHTTRVHAYIRSAHGDPTAAHVLWKLHERTERDENRESDGRDG